MYFYPYDWHSYHQDVTLVLKDPLGILFCKLEPFGVYANLWNLLLVVLQDSCIPGCLFLALLDFSMYWFPQSSFWSRPVEVGCELEWPAEFVGLALNARVFLAEVGSLLLVWQQTLVNDPFGSKTQPSHSVLGSYLCYVLPSYDTDSIGLGYFLSTRSFWATGL